MVGECLVDAPVGRLRIQAPPGYDLADASWTGSGVIARVSVRSKRTADVRCSDCGSADMRGFGRREVGVVDAPCGGVRARLSVERRRLQCARCLRLSREQAPGMAESRRMTRRCTDWIGSQLAIRTNAEIASAVGLDEKSVRLLASALEVPGRRRLAHLADAVTCASCLRGADPSHHEIHHPIPRARARARAGGGAPAPFVALCRACHADPAAHWITRA